MNLFVTVNAAIAACALTRLSGVSAAIKEGAKWGYRSDDERMLHSNNWADEYESCGGTRQSPIDITTADAITANSTFSFRFSGRCPHYSLSEPNEPLEADVHRGNCRVTVGGDTVYNMAQFHMHAPSEHTLDGKAMDAEIHFVHKSSTDALLVIGIFLDLGVKSDPWLSPLLDALEKVNSAEKTDAIVVRLGSYARLIQKAMGSEGIYNYPGSLTTPGCDETVDWWVVRNPIKISSIDFGRLHQDLLEYEITDDGNNARPVQNLLDRTVTYYPS